MGNWCAFCLIFIAAATAQAAEPWKELSRQLNSGTPSERLAAAEALGDLGIDAEPAVPALINALKAKEIALQHEAVLALGNIGPAAAEAVPTMLELLNSSNILLRHSAAETLGNIGPAAKAALPALLKQLKDSEPICRVAAASAIASIAEGKSEAAKEALAVLMTALVDKNSAVSSSAIPGIAALGATAVPGLIPMLKDESAANMIGVCHTLGIIGRDAAAAAPGLILLLKHSDSAVQAAAAEALGHSASRDKPGQVVIALEHALTNQDGQVRAQAARALGRLGPAAAAAVSNLRKLLKDKSDVTRRAALWSLGEIGPAAGEAAADVDAAWDDPVGSVTMQAAETSSRLGPAALPKLKSRLSNPKFTFLAASGLQELGPEAAGAVPELIEALGVKSANTRREVVLALAAIGPKAKAAAGPLFKIAETDGDDSQPLAVYALVMLGEKDKLLPLVRKRINAKDDRVRMVSAWALIMLGENAASDLPAVISALRDGMKSPRPLARRESIMAISRLGPQGAALAPDLAKALDDEELEVRDVALRALAELGKEAEPALPRLLKLLTDLPDGPERSAVIYVLGRMGPVAVSASPALIKFAKGKDPFVSALCAWSLVQINPIAEVRELAIPLLVAALKSERPRVREEAARTLGVIGTGNQTVREALEKIVSDDNVQVSAAVKEALKKLAKP